MTFKERRLTLNILGLEHEILKFHDFSFMPWPVRTPALTLVLDDLTENRGLLTVYYSADTQTGTLGRRLSNHNFFFENKKFLSFFFKRTNNIHNIWGLFPERSGKFKWFQSFQRLHSWTMNFIGPFVIAQSSSNCPGLGVSTLTV